jgi:hypothetical protein
MKKTLLRIDQKPEELERKIGKMNSLIGKTPEINRGERRERGEEDRSADDIDERR